MEHMRMMIYFKFHFLPQNCDIACQRDPGQCISLLMGITECIPFIAHWQVSSKWSRKAQEVKPLRFSVPWPFKDVIIPPSCISRDGPNCTAKAGKLNWPGKQLLASHLVVESEHMLERMKALGQSLIQDFEIVSCKSWSDMKRLYITFNKSSHVICVRVTVIWVSSFFAWSQLYIPEKLTFNPAISQVTFANWN